MRQILRDFQVIVKIVARHGPVRHAGWLMEKEDESGKRGENPA